jgi:ribosomal protein L31
MSNMWKTHHFGVDGFDGRKRSTNVHFAYSTMLPSMVSSCSYEFAKIGATHQKKNRNSFATGLSPDIITQEIRTAICMPLHPSWDNVLTIQRGTALKDHIKVRRGIGRFTQKLFSLPHFQFQFQHFQFLEFPTPE